MVGVDVAVVAQTNCWADSTESNISYMISGMILIKWYDIRHDTLSSYGKLQRETVPQGLSGRETEKEGSGVRSGFDHPSDASRYGPRHTCRRSEQHSQWSLQ